MKFKKIISTILTLTMLMTFIPSIGSTASAADTGKAIQLKAGGISDPTATQDSSGKYYTPGDYVYFGVKDSDPIMWRVLDADKANDKATSGMFLLSEYLFYDDVKFKGSTSSDDGEGQTNPNEWQYSDAQKWCSTFATNSFTAAEKMSLLGIAKTDSDEIFYSLPWGASSLTENDKVFFLSVRELADYVGNYDKAPGLIAYTDSSQSNAENWWLRSPCADGAHDVGVVFANGAVMYSNTGYGWAARPAFNLDLNAVLFTSAADNSGRNSDFSEPADYDGNEWKVTLKDNNDFSDGASLSGTTDLEEGYEETDLTITHKELSTLSSDYTNVTAVLTDASGKILYYGSINDDVSATESTVTIPSGLSEGEYTLSVYGEDWNDEKLTDYATGTPYKVKITVAPPSYEVTVNDTVTNGTATGAGKYKSGETVTITFTPDTSYFLYTVFVDGVEDQSAFGKTEYTFTMPENDVEITPDFVAGKPIYFDNSTSGWSHIYANHLDGAHSIYGNSVDLGSEIYGFSISPSADTVRFTNYKPGMPLSEIPEGYFVSEEIEHEAGETYTYVGYDIDVDSGIDHGTVEVKTDNFTISKASFGQQVTLHIKLDTGYSFKSLTVDSSNVTNQVSDGKYTFSMPRKDIAVDAEFIIPRGITLVANNGTDQKVTYDVAEGSKYTLTDDAFTYGKYEIMSWNTEADGSGIPYYNDEEFTIYDDLVLYAQWVLPLNKLAAFSDGDLEWSGNSASPYSLKIKNGGTINGSIMLPAKTNDDKTTITVDGDSEIKGSVYIEKEVDNYRGNITIDGNGTLKVYNIKASGSGDTLTVKADTTIISDYFFLGASGGVDSKIVVNNATLTINDLTLLQYITLEGNAKLNVNGKASFHSAPEINLSDKSEIYLAGNGIDCTLYKEGTSDNTSFDALQTGGYLPNGYNFKEYNYGYYLYDNTNNLVTGAVTIKKPGTGGNGGGGGGISGTTSYTVKFNTNGGSQVANQSVDRNDKVEMPDSPTKDGYIFDGWYTNDALTTAYNFESPVVKGFTLYAKWKEDSSSSANNHKDCPSLAFRDLDITSWYHYDTDFVIENDIFKGVGTNTFAPNGNITRGMMITVLYRAENEPEVDKDFTFTDVDKDAYYAKAVAWGQKNGIIKGYSETKYAPEQDITREQIAAIMHRYAQYKGYNVSVGENTNILSYDDFENISEYAIPAMQWAVGSGMIKGRTASTLNPKDNAIRVEIAAMLHRFIRGNQ